MNILKRSSTTINIATYWENFQLEKYNFNPAYQRPSDVWSASKKSFLIDTILKNFPMPPIFLHQHIDSTTGKTMYDVIDGKQRLSAIISFINNEITTPDDFNSDNFGDNALAGILFRDFENPIISEWKKIFWRYEITIEYIDTDQIEIVNNIFDRLNRNGEPLTKQELRNAKYHASAFYQMVKRLAQLEEFNVIFDRIQRNRLEDEEFTSELIFTLIANDIISGDSPASIDGQYEQLIKDTDFNISEFENLFRQITYLLQSWQIDYEGYKIQSLSHFYALWVLAMRIYLSKNDYPNIPVLLNNFYTGLRNGDYTVEIYDYKSSMSAGTKSKSQRRRRVNALMEYCDIGLNF